MKQLTGVIGRGRVSLSVRDAVTLIPDQEPRLTLSYTPLRSREERPPEYRQNGLAILTSVISLPEFYDCDCSTAADSGEMKATKWPTKQPADLQSQQCAAVTLLNT